MPSGKKKTHEEFVAEIYELVKDEYTIIGKYIKALDDIKIRHNCNDCNNHEWSCPANQFLKGSRCPVCSMKKAGEKKAKNIEGLRYGKLVAVEKAGKDKHGSRLWKCQCDCGNNIITTTTSLLMGYTKSCGCTNKTRMKEIGINSVKDLTGQKYGKLTVLGRANNEITKDGKSLVAWRCKCDCGSDKEVIVKTGNLKAGTTNSCGCLRYKDLTGKKVNHLTVLHIDETKERGLNNCVYWLCECDCDNKTIMSVPSTRLIHNSIKSCRVCAYERSAKDLTGQVFDKIKVIKRDKSKKGVHWFCQCECGKIFSASSKQLNNNHIKSCGCLKTELFDSKQKIDLVGQKFNKLLVEKFIGIKNHQKIWLCKCDCGNYTEVNTHKLKSGNTKSCGCLQKEYAANKEYEDLSGQTFGRWYVIKRIIEKNLGKRGKYIYKTWYLCKCSCDKQTERLVRSYDLKSGKSTSCGCINYERITQDMIGENHPNYNPNLTEQDRRDMERYKREDWWREKVFKKDNYTCQICGKRSGKNKGKVFLNAHHLDGYDWCKEKRKIIKNGITLCEGCHKKFHKIYGYGNNTKEQFDEFKNQIKNKKTIHEIDIVQTTNITIHNKSEILNS